jgi:hypothetical protein
MQSFTIPKRHLQRMLVSVRTNHLHTLHRQINLLAAVGTHAKVARGQLFSARRRRLPNAPPHRGPVCRHPRMLEGPRRGTPLECVWRDLPRPYNSSQAGAERKFTVGTGFAKHSEEHRCRLSLVELVHDPGFLHLVENRVVNELLRLGGLCSGMR